VTLFQMDFHGRRGARALKTALDGPPDLVLSDMAANTVGHKQTDHLRTMGLVEAAADFAIAPGAGRHLRGQGAGGRDGQGSAGAAQAHFTTVKHAKPPASRKDSAANGT
jgi:23S rRNA (uridine2552-2'-O)-methyltransferase